MSETTYTNIPRARQGSQTGGWFSNLMERIVEAQAARVRREVYAQLRGFNDETLNRLGFNAGEIARLRRGEYVAMPA